MQKIITKMGCRFYGFECGFETNEDEAEKVINEFRKHTLEEHHIDYSEGVLMNFILRKNSKKVF